MTDILNRPLRAIGGQVKQNSSITLYMHDGYDRPILDIEVLCCRAERICSGEDQLFQIGGSRQNPLFSWPIYARKKRS